MSKKLRGEPTAGQLTTHGMPMIAQALCIAAAAPRASTPAVRARLQTVAVRVVASASAALLVLLPAAGASAQTPAPPASVDPDAGAPPDLPPPAAEAAPAPPSDAAPAPPAPPSPEPASIALPVTLVGGVAVPTVPAAAPAPAFGRRGQVAVYGGANISASSSSFDGSSATRTSYVFSPGLDYFVSENIAIGLSIDAGYADGKGYGADGSLVDTRTTTLSAGPRLGLNVPIGGPLSWFPEVTLGFEWTRQSEQLVSGTSLSVAASQLGYPSTTQFGPFVDIYLPFLLHPTDHFFIGFGPEFFHDFGTVSGGPNIGGQRTELSANLTVGGYWGGERSPDATRAAPAAPAPGPRFGDAGQLVLSNDLVLSVTSLTYAGTDSTSRSVAIGGSIDYFVIDHVSLGVGASVASTYAKGIDPTTSVAVTSSHNDVSFAPRLGLDLPLGSAFSLYPQFELAVGHAVYDETSASSEDKYAEDTVSVSLFVPFLVHPAQHVFVGFGPTAYHDLSNAVASPDPLAPSVQNRETTFGLGTILGGWL